MEDRVQLAELNGRIDQSGYKRGSEFLKCYTSKVRNLLSTRYTCVVVLVDPVLQKGETRRAWLVVAGSGWSDAQIR